MATDFLRIIDRQAPVISTRRSEPRGGLINPPVRRPLLWSRGDRRPVHPSTSFSSSSSSSYPLRAWPECCSAAWAHLSFHTPRGYQHAYLYGRMIDHLRGVPVLCFAPARVPSIPLQHSVSQLPEPSGPDNAVHKGSGGATPRPPATMRRGLAHDETGLEASLPLYLFECR